MTNIKNKRETAAISCERITISDLNSKQHIALQRVLRGFEYLNMDIVNLELSKTALPYEGREYVTVAVWAYKHTIIESDRRHRFVFCIGKRGGLFVKDLGFKVKRLDTSNVYRYAEV